MAAGEPGGRRDNVVRNILADIVMRTMAPVQCFIFKDYNIWVEIIRMGNKYF